LQKSHKSWNNADWLCISNPVGKISQGAGGLGDVASDHIRSQWPKLNKHFDLSVSEVAVKIKRIYTDRVHLVDALTAPHSKSNELHFVKYEANGRTWTGLPNSDTRRITVFPRKAEKNSPEFASIFQNFRNGLLTVASLALVTRCYTRS
jgi:hypothetical protein